MKKVSLLFALVAFFAGLSFAQNNTVTVVKANGEKVTYNTSDVQKIIFGSESSSTEPSDPSTPGVTDPDPVSPSDAVDLGLSVKWAACNLGANAPEGYGNYYAWGEIAPKEKYSEDTYSLWDPEWGYRNLGQNITETYYDAAYRNLGEGWRMPTLDEWIELISTCDWKWSSVNGRVGYKVTGSNGNSIFLPAAGRLYDIAGEKQNGYEEVDGFYWTADVLEHDDYNYRCSRISFGSNDVFYTGGDVPFIGMSIRPVYGAMVDTDPEPEPGPMDMVDLGLSVKWASHNVGASKDTEIGNFYAWGVNRVQTTYGDPAYKWYEGSDRNENGSYMVYTDLGTDIAGTKYDVATVRWGEGWRMPSREEFEELHEKCTWAYKSGKGWTVTGPNGNSIFLPIGGYAGVEGVICNTPNDPYKLPFQSFYATGEEKVSTLYPSNHSRWCFKINDSSVSYDPHKVDDTFKSLGVCVRPVHK